MTDRPVSSSLPPLSIEPPAELTRRIHEHVLDDLKPARGSSPLQRWALGLVGIAVPLVLVGLLYPKAQEVLWMALAFALVIGAATYVCIAKAGTTRVTVPTRIVFALVPLITFSVLWLATREPMHAAGGPGAAAHLGCFVRGAMLSLVPMAALVMLWRRTDPFSPRLSGAVLGGWAGFTGALGLAMSCPATDSGHILVGHGAAVLVGAALGAVVGGRALRP